MKLASCKSALTPPVVYSADRSKEVVPVLVLLFVALWIYSTRRFFMSYLVLFCPCVFVCFFFFFFLLFFFYVVFFFSSFSISITLLGEERTNLSVFRTCVPFALVWFCLV